MSNFHVDWFEVTEPLGRSEFSDFMHETLYAWDVKPRHAKGQNGYRERLMWNDALSESFSSSDERMGRHWTFTGSSFDKIIPNAEREDNWRYWVRKWGELGRGNITRIDLASDFAETDVRAVAADIMWGMNEGLVRKRKWTEMSNSHDGYTMYFGSRQSDVMLRCYDKGAQLNLEPFRMARAEFEIKGNKSRFVGDGLRTVLLENTGEQNSAGDYLESVAFGLYLDFMPLSTLENIGVSKWGCQPITLGSWLPKATNNDAWWWNVVLPALAKRLRKVNGEFDQQFWSTFQDVLINSMGGSADAEQK